MSSLKDLDHEPGICDLSDVYFISLLYFVYTIALLQPGFLRLQEHGVFRGGAQARLYVRRAYCSWLSFAHRMIAQALIAGSTRQTRLLGRTPVEKTAPLAHTMHAVNVAIAASTGGQDRMLRLHAPLTATSPAVALQTVARARSSLPAPC